MLMKRRGLFVKGSHRRNGRFLAWKELKQILSSRNSILLTSSGFIYREREEVQRKLDLNLPSLYIRMFLLPSFSCKCFLRACDREFYREKWKSLKCLCWFNVIMFFLLLGTSNFWLCCAPNSIFKINSFRIESARYHIWCNGKRKDRGKICLQVMNYIIKLLHLFFKPYCIFFMVYTQKFAFIMLLYLTIASYIVGSM